MLKDTKEAAGAQSQILNHDIFHSFGGQTMMSRGGAADGTPVSSHDGLSPPSSFNHPHITEKINSFVPAAAGDNKGNVRTFYYGLNSNLGPGSSMSNLGSDASPSLNKDSGSEFSSFAIGR